MGTVNPCRSVVWEMSGRTARSRCCVLIAGALLAAAGVALAHPASASSTPLPDLASVEQVIGAQQAW